MKKEYIEVKQEFKQVSNCVLILIDSNNTMLYVHISVNSVDKQKSLFNATLKIGKKLVQQKIKIVITSRNNKKIELVYQSAFRKSFDDLDITWNGTLSQNN